jgi:hypothetical protein
MEGRIMPKKAVAIGSFLAQEVIERRIYLIRGKKVMLDRDLSSLYEVSTSYMNRSVKRHLERFPNDFMFELSKNEVKNLKCQFGTSSWGGTRKRPRAFTDYGILMLSSVVNSPRAIHVNIQIMRTFSRLREMLLSHKNLEKRLEELEKRYDDQFKVVFDAIRELLATPEKPKRQIGFHAK